MGWRKSQQWRAQSIEREALRVAPEIDSTLKVKLRARQACTANLKALRAPLLIKALNSPKKADVRNDLRVGAISIDHICVAGEAGGVSIFGARLRCLGIYNALASGTPSDQSPVLLRRKATPSILNLPYRADEGHPEKIADRPSR
jgi:hypothetical protein